MCDSKKTKTTLVEELKTLRSRTAELERIEAEHKRAEEALRENERFLQDIFDAMQDGISVLDRDLNIVRVNLWMEKRYAERMPLVGKKCYIAYQKRKSVCPWCPSVRAIETGEAQTEVIPYPRTDKSIGWVELSAFPLKDVDGKVTGVIEHVKDVTDPKRMEEMLRESEQYYRGLIDCSTDVIWRVNLDGILTFVSPSAKALCGFEVAEIIGAPFEKILTEEGARKAREFLERRKRGESGKGTVTLEIAHRRKDGTEFVGETRSVPILDANDELVGIQGVTRDITERKKAEEALRESEERYKALFQGAAEGILVADVETMQFGYANPAICKMLGYTEEELRQMGVRDIHPEGDLEHVISEFEAQVRGEIVLAPNIPCLRKNGTIMYADVNSATVMIDGRECNVGFFTDITERKKAEEELLFKSTLLEAQSETSIDGILVVDDEGKSISFNKNFGRMWNIPQQILNTRDDEEMLRYVLSQLKNPDRFLERVKYLYAHKNEKSRDEIQFRDGKVFDRYSSPLLDSNDQYCGRVWYFRDITKRKRAVEAYRAIVDHSLQGFAIFRERCFVFANQAMAEITGYTVEEMLAMSSQQVQELVHRDDRALVWGRHQDRLEGKQVPEHYELRGIRKDGTMCWLEIHASRIEYRGRPAIQAAYLDITDRKRTEKELRKARKDLEIRVEQRTEELAKTVIELQSEIGERKRAQSQLILLAQELSLAEERLRRRIADNLHDNIGQNLAISKIKIESLQESAASSELAEELGEIRDLIGQVIASSRSLTFELSPPVLYQLGFEAAVKWLVKRTRQRHELSADFKSDGHPKPLSNDISVLLFQAVRELLVNVVKHAKANNITVSTRMVDDKIQVIVEDDGIGFDIFTRGSHGYKTSGFGLFSIRERLRHIGGRLEVESKPGFGTRVTLVAPIDQERQNNKKEQHK